MTVDSGTSSAERTEPLVWIDGRAVAARGGALSPLDRGLLLADGLFETMRVRDGRVFRLDAHLARLGEGCGVLRIAPPAALGEMLRAAIDGAARAGVHEGRLRLTVTRGIGPGGLAPPAHATPTTIIVVQPLGPIDEAMHERGITACVARGRLNERAATAGLKTLAYTDAVLALAEARDALADDAIRLDTRDHLAEATASNLFLVIDGELLTPPRSCGVLPGITRAAALECARGLGLAAAERELTLEALWRAEEAFLTSSVRGIVPLVRVDGRAIGAGEPGPTTRRLMEAYAALVRSEGGA